MPQDVAKRANEGKQTRHFLRVFGITKGNVIVYALFWFWDENYRSLATVQCSSSTHNGRYLHQEWEHDHEKGAVQVVLEQPHACTVVYSILGREQNGRCRPIRLGDNPDACTVLERVGR